MQVNLCKTANSDHIRTSSGDGPFAYAEDVDENAAGIKRVSGRVDGVKREVHEVKKRVDRGFREVKQIRSQVDGAAGKIGQVNRRVGVAVSEIA